MKKILLLLITMFTFANYSLAEKWIFIDNDPAKSVSFYLDIDSVVYDNGKINFKQKVEGSRNNFYCIFDSNFNFDTNSGTTTVTLYDKDGRVIVQKPEFTTEELYSLSLYARAYLILKSYYSYILSGKTKDEWLLKIILILEMFLIFVLFKKNKISCNNVD